MADYTQYPMTDENFNYPPEVRKAMAESSELAEVINSLIKKALPAGGTGTGSGTGGSTVVVGGITTVYFDDAKVAWPTRPAVSTPVWWLSSKTVTTLVPSDMANGDMITRVTSA